MEQLDRGGGGQGLTGVTVRGQGRDQHQQGANTFALRSTVGLSLHILPAQMIAHHPIEGAKMRNLAREQIPHRPLDLGQPFLAESRKCHEK